MANEGSTKPTYSELESQFNHEFDERTKLISELARVRGLLQRLRVASDDVASKLESQVCRDSSLPEAYRAILQTYWEVSRELPNFRESSSLVPQGAESADIGKLDTAPQPYCAECGKQRKYNGIICADCGSMKTTDTPPTCKSGVEMGKVNRVDGKADKECGAIAFGWQNFVAGKTIQCAYDTGEWAVIQFTDGTKLEIVSSAFHMIEAARQ